MKPIHYLVLSTPVLLLIGCGGPPAPTDEEVRSSLALEFPSYWNPVDFRILGLPGWSTDSGGPGLAARFEATMELTTPTYLLRGQSVEELVVEEFGAPGDRVTLTGRVQALRGDRGWAVQFFLDDNPTHRFGRTMESLVGEARVVRLSKSEND
jgi:hypothetical protein